MGQNVKASGVLARALRGASCVFALFFLILILACFSGCKYSDVLTQHIEDPDKGVLDETAEPTYVYNPESEVVLDLASYTLDPTAAEENTQVAMLPHYDPNAPDNGPTIQRTYSEETPHDEEASQGEEEAEESDREGEGEGEQGGEETNENAGEGEGQDKGTGDPLEDVESDEVNSSESGSTGGEEVIVDPDGTTEDTVKGTVAAVGEYATIAQMLGGAGALAACDEAWREARNDDGAFSGELDKVQTAFSGDGARNGSCNVDALINEIKPSAVLWDRSANIPALNENERKKLEAAGITVQAVPHIGEQDTEDNEVQLAVAEVASVLKGAGGLEYDPSEVYSIYNEFHDEVLKACYDANGGYSYKYCGTTQLDQLYQDTPLSGLRNSIESRFITVYVDDLYNSSRTSLKVTRHDRSSVQPKTLSVDASDGIGLSGSSSTKGYLLIDYYLQLAGVVNNAYDTAKPDVKGRSYILMPGSDEANLSTSNAYGSRANDTGSAFSYWIIDKDVPGNWKQLGDPDFNTVLVANSDIMNALVSSAKKKNGLYNMDDSYEVVVVPTGIAGSWSRGHVDSFLLAPWAFRVQNSANLDVATDFASQFYSTFFRCDKWKKAVSDWDTSKKAK